MAIEVEVRGPLPGQDFERLRSFLESKATFKKKKERTLVCYSLMNDLKSESSIDIRARVTNNIPEIIIKKGKWGGEDAREEISVLLQPGQFNNLLKAYAALGYNKGLLCVRNTLVYEYEGVEFALVEVPDHSYFFEAEMIVSSNEEIQKARETIRTLCSQLQLSIFTDDEFFSYIDTLDKEANKEYAFHKHGELEF